MSKIAEVLKASEKMRSGEAAAVADIGHAEEALGLKFANEYKEYLMEFGFASYKGHELTGICKSSRLNVVDVTLEVRGLYDMEPNMYVVEDTGYEGIMILQNQKGKIFTIRPHSKPEKIAESLVNYIHMK